MVFKKYKKAAIDLTTSSIVLSAGSQAVSGIGGNTGALNNLSKGLPTLGTTAGAGMVIGSLGYLRTKRRRR